MSFDAATPVLEREWVVIDERPLYGRAPSGSYYDRPQHVEDDDPRHLRVVKFMAAQAEGPDDDF